MSDMDNVRTPTYTLGENIRKAREDMGWKQSDLAVRVKVSRAAIAGWENNSHRPSALAIDKIAELTGYPVGFFVGHGPEDGGDIAPVTIGQLRNILRDNGAVFALKLAA